ncbi:hypothetical protein SPHINGO8BC_150715 [Sphingobacterium multivorum]|uniref:Uncharacterized protein n=1 Tax=Sphingobacterium multivorum TaxID=28454 RepID=A0A654AZS8_SPHMU|nr:hypothetical protein SPHINGO8BC_150715 [Sphingobacterium multivorum]
MIRKGKVLLNKQKKRWKSIAFLSSPEQNRTAIKCLGNIYSIR